MNFRCGFEKYFFVTLDNNLTCSRALVACLRRCISCSIGFCQGSCLRRCNRLAPHLEGRLTICKLAYAIG